MKNLKTLLLFVSIVFTTACSNSKKSTSRKIERYKPDDEQLYNTVVHLDSIFFSAYNTCNMNRQAEIYADSIEFYHDKGGLMTSKQGILDATKKNICDKVTRELVPGSIEVYPIKDYGAIEMGLHKFHNNMEKEGTPSKESKFIIIWHQTKDSWKISRVVSLH
jgi:ketosteroid isomerase-like protein